VYYYFCTDISNHASSTRTDYFVYNLSIIILRNLELSYWDKCRI